jgi:hypothetical protein
VGEYILEVPANGEDADVLLDCHEGERLAHLNYRDGQPIAPLL